MIKLLGTFVLLSSSMVGSSFAATYEEGSRTSGQSCNHDVDCAGKCMCANGKCGGSDTCNAALVVKPNFFKVK